MRWAIDLVLLAILLLCGWNGYRKGFIMCIGGVLSIAVSLYAACLLSGTFSHEVVPVIRPFASGYMERVISGTVTEQLGLIYQEETPASERYSVNDALSQDAQAGQRLASLTFKSMGIYDSAADQMAEESVDYASLHEVDTKTAMVEVLCQRAVYVAGVILSFFIILIVLTVIGNIPNLSFRLPNMVEVDEIGGTIMGIFKGMLFCMLLVWALKFMGLVIGKETLASTILGRFFVKIGFISLLIGI